LAYLWTTEFHLYMPFSLDLVQSYSMKPTRLFWSKTRFENNLSRTSF